jgi:hypothetical protein
MRAERTTLRSIMLRITLGTALLVSTSALLGCGSDSETSEPTPSFQSADIKRGGRRAGQPGTEMPSALKDTLWSVQQIMDVLAHAQTLPTQ